MKVPIRSHFIFTAGFVTTAITGLSLYHHHQIYNNTQILGNLKNKLDFNLFSNRQAPSENVFENIKTMIRNKLKTTNDNTKVMYGLIGINTLVFISWQVPQWSRFMNRVFVHLPIRSSPFTLLTCVFSHQNLMHFGFNMVHFCLILRWHYHRFIQPFARMVNYRLQKV
jgi:hypothetical protein